MKKIILFIVNEDTFFMSHRLPIALSSSKQGYEVHIATKVTTCKKEMEEFGFIVHRLNLDRKSFGFVSNGRTFFEIVLLLRKLRPDLIHLVTIKPVIFGGLATKLVEVKAVVAAISGLGYIFTSNGFIARFRRVLIKFLYYHALNHKNIRVIFQNDQDRSLLQGLTKIKESQIEMIRGSGVDLAFYGMKPLPKGLPLVILPARLIKDKGIIEFVEAVKILKKKKKNGRFVLLGKVDEGNPTSLTKSQVHKWEEDGLIEWWDFNKNIPKLFGSAYAIVLPSYREGLPKVLIEASACGRPIVTTDVAGCRDAIKPGLTGLLVPPFDPGALSNAIEKLIDNPKLSKKMGMEGRKFAEKAFDIRKVISCHLEIYDNLLT